MSEPNIATYLNLSSKTGLYMFTWTGVSSGNGDRYLSHLYMNSDIIASGRSSSNASNPFSNTVVVHCEAGARLYVQVNVFIPCFTNSVWLSYILEYRVP